MKKVPRSRDLVLPTPGELRLLQILWRIGGGTIDEHIPSKELRELEDLIREHRKEH